jgi:hypothetical protein
MNLPRVIRTLRVRLAEVEKLIATPEALRTQSSEPPKRKRGRKSMGLEERRDVAKRMRAFWAARNQGTKTTAH